METLVHQRKMFSVNFSKAKENISWVYITIMIGSMCNRFGATEFREVSVKGNVYDFSVDCNAIDNFNG